MAVLTNGLLWWFYLPLAKGPWRERRFFTIDINQQEASAAALHFKDFLSKEAVASGASLESARSLLASHEKKQQIAAVMPRAWRQLLEGPDELVLERFADKVESMSGYRPEPEDLSAYLRQQPPNAVAASVASSARSVEPVVHRDPAHAATRQKGIVVRIDGNRFEADSVPHFYAQVLKFLCEKGYMEVLKSHLPYATSARRYLIANQPVHPNGNPFRNPVDHAGYFMEAHKDYRNAQGALDPFLRLCGLELQAESGTCGSQP